MLLGMLLCTVQVKAQNITNGDGSALTTRYCYENSDFELKGVPAGGNFSGCGMIFKSGGWFLNPVTAAVGTTIFPFQCTLTYTVGNNTVSRIILIHKPVKIDPPLQDIQTCDGAFTLTTQTLYAGAYDYRWEPAAVLSNPDTSVTDGWINQSDTFLITAVDHVSNCMGSDTITVFKRPYPEVTATPEHKTITSRETVQLQATGALNYSWLSARWLNNDRIPNPIATPRETVTYTVVGRNEYGCADTAQVQIKVLDKLFVPNAFSPNGDGKNDIFRIENFGFQQIDEFRIYNRWGKLVFETQNGLTGWNGLIKGLAAESGTYFYNIKVRMPGNELKTLKGDLLLIR